MPEDPTKDPTPTPAADRSGKEADPAFADPAPDLNLALLLCTRLCHDLAGPIGALTTGAELLEDEAGASGSLDAEALSLLGDSARLAAARLRLLRLATGVAKGRGPALTQAADALAEALPREGRRLEVDPALLAVGSAPDPGPQAVRLVCLLVLVAAEAWPRAEVLSLAPVAGSGTGTGTGMGAPLAGLRIAAPGEAAALAGPWREALDPPWRPGSAEAPTEPRHVLALLAGQLARRGGFSITAGPTGEAGILLALPGFGPSSS